MMTSDALLSGRLLLGFLEVAEVCAVDLALLGRQLLLLLLSVGKLRGLAAFDTSYTLCRIK